MYYIVHITIYIPRSPTPPKPKNMTQNIWQVVPFHSTTSNLARAGVFGTVLWLCVARSNPENHLIYTIVNPYSFIVIR